MDLHGPIALCESNLTMEVVMGFVVDEHFLAMSYSFVTANQYLNIEPLVEYVLVIVADAISMTEGGFMSLLVWLAWFIHNCLLRHFVVVP